MHTSYVYSVCRCEQEECDETWEKGMRKLYITECIWSSRAVSSSLNPPWKFNLRFIYKWSMMIEMNLYINTRTEAGILCNIYITHIDGQANEYGWLKVVVWYGFLWDVIVGRNVSLKWRRTSGLKESWEWWWVWNEVCYIIDEEGKGRRHGACENEGTWHESLDTKSHFHDMYLSHKKMVPKSCDPHHRDTYARRYTCSTHILHTSLPLLLHAATASLYSTLLFYSCWFLCFLSTRKLLPSSKSLGNWWAQSPPLIPL